MLECFLHANPVLGEIQKSQYEPHGLDKVTSITRDHGAEIFLDKDARKWANKFTKDQVAITSLKKQVKGLQSVTSAYTKARMRLLMRLSNYDDPLPYVQQLFTLFFTTLESRVWHIRIPSGSFAKYRLVIGGDAPVRNQCYQS